MQDGRPPLPLGHNGGPPLDEEDDPLGARLFTRYCWHAAHKAAWANPSLDIIRFRVRRAAAAGVSYRTYTSILLDTGRHLQQETLQSRPAPLHEGRGSNGRTDPDDP